jgi:hypothetical protein
MDIINWFVIDHTVGNDPKPVLSPEYLEHSSVKDVEGHICVCTSSKTDYLSRILWMVYACGGVSEKSDF